MSTKTLQRIRRLSTTRNSAQHIVRWTAFFVAQVFLVSACLASAQDPLYEWPPTKFSTFKACLKDLGLKHGSAIEYGVRQFTKSDNGWTVSTVVTEGVKVAGRHRASLDVSRRYTNVSDNVGKDYGADMILVGGGVNDEHYECDGRTQRYSSSGYATPGEPRPRASIPIPPEVQTPDPPR